MATIKKSYTVVPADPTPKGPLHLSELDQTKPWTLSPLIYVYDHKPTNLTIDDLAHTITTSLSRVMVPFYPLAGRLRWIGGGRLEIDCNAMGAELVVAESRSNLQELGNFEPTPKISHLVPNIDYASPIHMLPIVSVLVTKFACGGVTIGTAISHAVVDGTSYTHFVNSWAKLARGEDLSQHEMPSHDRFKLPCHHAPKFDHPELKPLPMVMGRSSCEEEQGKETSVAMLKLTKDQVNHLKKKANYHNIEDHQKPYSTYEAVTAHVWRCACKARREDTKQPTVVRVIVDCRSRMKPPLQRGYTGNAILNTITDTTCVFGELVSKPLGYGAGKIREAIENFRDEYIVSALSFVSNQEDVSRLRSSFHIVGSRAGQFLGNPNISVTSWINLPLYEADFGWGKPRYVGPSAMVSDGKCYIMSGDDSDGSVVVALRLQTQHMNLFKMFFYKDIYEEDISDITSKL